METIFFRNKRTTALAIAMIVAAGLSALLSVGRQEDPTISSIFATIVTPFPGADPARIESLVTEVVEDNLREIPQIRNIESTSRLGISVVTAELSWDLNAVEIEQAWSEVRDALSDAAVEFPEGVPEPSFDDDRTGAFSAISAIYAASGDRMHAGIASRYADLLQERIRRIPGTKLVTIYGEEEEEILVTLDAARLNSMGLSFEAVSRAIANADTKISAGQVRAPSTELLIEVTGEIEALSRIRKIPLTTDDSGAAISVGDIAEVARSLKSPSASIAYADGKRAVLIAAKTEHGVQVDAWMARVNQVLADFESELPAGLRHELLFDQSAYTSDRLDFVMTNMAIGAALVIAVLLVTLGWRAAVVVATILPLAALMSLAGFQFLGIPIHQMSVTGLIVALGLLVDAGIVMADEIRKRLSKGMARELAVKSSVRRLAAPLLASTVTTALAFTPMALLPGPAGDFVGSIAAAVIIMLISSFVLAMTITPALSGWLLHRTLEGDKAHTEQNKSGYLRRVSSGFSSSLMLSLRFPKLSILGALVLPMIGFGAFPTLEAQFFPGVDRDQFYVQVKLPDGSAIANTDRTAQHVEKEIRSFEGIKSVHWVMGESAPSFYYNMLVNQDGQPSFAEALITTSSPEATESILPDLQRHLDATIPNARVTVRGLVQGPPVNAPVEIRVVGPELSELRRIGDEIRSVMAASPEITQAKTQLVGGAPKAFIDINEYEAKLVGLQLSSFANELEHRLEGEIGGSLIDGSEELPVRVRVGSEDRSSFVALRQIEFSLPQTVTESSGYPAVPLTSIGQIRLQPNDTSIYRRNGERTNIVQGYTHRHVLPEEALKRILARVDASDIFIPVGYRLEVGGDADARSDVVASLLAGAGLIVAFTVAAIVLTFNSYRLSAITGVVAVLSIGLSVFALAVLNYPFGIQAMIGVIGSIGVSINAAIIILTALQRRPETTSGDLSVIHETVRAQSRHIFSTTITTFGGFLPLILAGGGFWPPFAVAVAGGVLLSTVISFYFVPPAYLLVANRKFGRGTKDAIETPALGYVSPGVEPPIAAGPLVNADT